MADTTASNPSVNYMEKIKSYAKTQKGMILAAEIFISFIIFICYIASYFGGYAALAVIEMVMAIVFFGIYTMELDKQIKVVSWVWSDFFRAICGAVLYIITSLICVTKGHGDSALIVGGVFGLIAGLLFAYDTYTIFLQIKITRQHAAASTDDRV